MFYILCKNPSSFIAQQGYKLDPVKNCLTVFIGHPILISSG